VLLAHIDTYPVWAADFNRVKPVEYTPTAVSKPGPMRTENVFPRYKLIPHDELFTTIMATQK
jgi:hypothetical protein